MHDETIAANDEKLQGVRAKPSSAAGSILYLTVLALMLLSSVFTPLINIDGDRYYILMLVIQLVTIGLPPIVYLIWAKKDIKYSLRLRKVSIPEILLSAGMAFFGYGVITFINLLWILFLSRFGTPQPIAIPPIENGRNYLLAIAVIAAVPALLEEFLFRGVIQRGFEKFGKAASILLAGILFAFLHISIVSIPSIILMGILLCYIAYRANTIWAGVTYHFVNNSIAVSLAFLSSVLTEIFPTDMEAVPGSLPDIPPDQMGMAIIAWAFIGFFSLLLFGSCLAGFHIITRGKQEELPAAGANTGNLLKVILPIAVAIVIIIALLVFEVIEMVNPTPIM